MRHRRSLAHLLIAVGLALGAGACAHHDHRAAARTAPAAEDDDPSAPPTSAARLTTDEATAIAVAKFPGEVVDRELEREHGRLIYSIEIHPDGQAHGIKEVNVDAIDGSIVNVEDEDEAGEDEDGEHEAGEHEDREDEDGEHEDREDHDD